MYDLDHMLNGRGSRQHLQHMIRQAQHEMFARQVEAAQGKDRTRVYSSRNPQLQQEARQGRIRAVFAAIANAMFMK